MIQFLSRMALVAAIFICGMGNPSPPALAEDPKADPFAGLVGFTKNYKIEVVHEKPTFPVQTTHGAIDGKPAGQVAVGSYLKRFLPEFGLYPPSLPRRAQLKRIVFCSELSFAGQRRSAIPDFEHDTLYLDVKSGSANHSYQRKGIHHEFFHLVDYRDDGLVYEDERWKSLNPSTFKYGTGGKNAQDMPETSLLTDQYPGFLNHYSTTGVEEDKAEMFANLIVDSTYVAERIKTDKVLKSKVERMKTLMLQFCPEVEEKFWEKAGKLPREQ